ncbi:hypothetical protein ABT147_44935 [Streptomyces sp. NPDC001868]|uniref:hypothetical protein n=1 Tax=Streptomyces sp. NPDC001868 TaxID=3154401 RepID=UPI00332D970A
MQTAALSEVDGDITRNSAGRWRHPARPHRIRADVDLQEVPVLPAPGETADNMLTSRVFGGWRSCWRRSGRDTRIVEQLAEHQAPSRYKPVQKDAKQSREAGGDGSGGPSASAKALLKFSTPRAPAALAAFINCGPSTPSTSTGGPASRPPCCTRARWAT